jgi:hypothetical protein
MRDDPFEVLGLPADATEEDAVRQGARICQTAGDEETRNAAREAVRQLTASAEERQLHALLTPPGFRQLDEGLKRWAAAHRRPPAIEARPVPPLDQAEAREVLRQLLLAEPAPPPAPLELVPDELAPEESRLLESEAAWRSLLHDPRG